MRQRNLITITSDKSLKKSDSLRKADDASSGMQGHAVVQISKCCKKLQTKKQTLI